VTYSFARAAIGLATTAALTASALTTAANGQTVQDTQVPAANLDLPANLQIFGKVDPNVRKATAIVNDTVITATDVDQRVALVVLANDGEVPGGDPNALRLQILRQLIDETLQIQEAKTADITITADEINQSFNGVAGRFKQTPSQFRDYLRKSNTSERSLRRQVEAGLAWQRYLRRRVEPFVNVGDEEVQAILDRLKQSQGVEEFAVKEIYMAAGPTNSEQVFANMRQITAELQKGQQPFEYFARQFSEASTRAVNGDLGWVRAAQLPDTLVTAINQMQVGQVAGPIEVPGGFSLIFLTDKRRVGTADPRDARLSLKQMTIRFPTGTSESEASGRTAVFAKAVQSLKGCGTVEKVAAGINADVVDNDTVRIRDLPVQLQDIMLKLQVGEATPPFGSPEQGVRTLVLCGRDEARGGELPGAAQVQSQLEQQRVNLRADQKLRDLRRDAVIEYR
jgi:peptidyl-prolyl cis-trans isomerase SurA